MFFDYKTTGVPFEPYTLQHLAAVILFLALPLSLIFIFRDKIRQAKTERWIRYCIVTFGMLTEFILYTWYILNGITDWRKIVPFGICGLSLYFTSYSMLTLNKAAAKISYFFLFGAFFSFLIPDISHGFERIRYYQFFIVHGTIFANVLYLNLIHGLRPTRKSFAHANLILFGLLALAYGVNQIVNFSFFYLSEPPFDQMPVYQYLYDVNHVLYSVSAVVSYFVVMSFMYLLARVTGLVRKPNVNHGFRLSKMEGTL